MAEVTLYRVPRTKLFVNCNPAGTAGNAPAGAFCFYHAADTLLDTLTFTESLSVSGAYAFLQQNTSNPFTVLANYLQGQVMANERIFFWMHPGWASPTKQLLVKNGVSDQVLTLPLPALSFIGMPDSGPDAGSMELFVPGAAVVRFGQDEIALVHKDAQIQITVKPRTVNLSPKNGIRIAVAGGPRCSTFNGELDEADTAKMIAVLAPQIRYRWPKPNTSVTETRAARILSDDRGAHLGVTAEFRLHRHSTDISSTSIGLVTKDATGGLKSELMDTDGYVLTLLPEKNAAIYFDKSASGSHASLNGKFAVQKSPADELATVNTTYREVMPGSAGTEFFQLGKDQYDGLEFFAAQPALIAYGAASENPTLSGQATTAWMAPCRIGGLQPLADSGFSFVTQPQDQPLYGRRDVSRANQSVDAFSVLFDPAPIQVEAPSGLPFFPFRGVRRKTLDVATTRIDSGALAPIRSQMAAASAAKLSTRSMQTFNVPTTWITTPQGLLVEIDEQNTWHRIKLGESEAVDGWRLVIDRPKDINNKPVERWALQEALSRPDVFVVVTRNDPSYIPGADDPPFGKITLALNIAGWPMDISFADAGGPVPVPDPNTPVPHQPPTRFEPAMVMKLTKGSIRDFLSDVSRWSLARVFNGDPQNSSLAALQSLDNLKMLSEGLSPLPEKATTDERKMAPELRQHYRDLYDRICDVSWTGILIFNAETPFDKVPDQVAVVTEGGPVGKAFSVPVLGIDVSRVVPGDDNEMKLEKTSAFGAIHFHDAKGLDEKGEFEFRLRTLNAVFMNTQLRIFLASMQLRLSKFFGVEGAVPAKLTPDNSRILDILARYETVAKDGVTGGEYVFRALGRRTMKFENSEFLTSMSATRIDVTCTRKGVDPNRYVESRFALCGQLEFGSKFSSVTGIRKIEFDNAALIMSQNNFDIDIGKVRVDFKKESINSDLSGLLAKFPLQLSAMRWSSSTTSSLSLPSVGFTGLSLPDFGGFAAPSFDFAIELELNLGSMGKLFEGADFLKAKILVGWYDVKNPLKGFSIGFRFEGGNGPLDIGINGVLRLTAESVKIQSYTTPSAGIGIGLLKPQLEVMGYKVPTNPTDVLVAFVPANGDNVAWGWARLDTKVGPLRLDYFAIGQRMKLVPDNVWGQDTPLEDIVQKSKDSLFPNGAPGKGEIPDIGNLYDSDAGWGVVARGKVFAFNFRFVFLDGLNRYGLGLDIPKLAKVDVIYRKLSDNQGVFSAEIEPAFRTLEMGAATVTLPVIGFDAVTNGNWALNIGYHGNDFSRGTTVQILPFIGSGGVRFGKLDWQSSYVLNSPDSPNRDLIRQLDLKPVIEMSLAVRIGLGKEFREGIFAAGITLSIYGIFEGAVGTPTHPNFPSAGNRRYIRVDGTMGLLLEIFGAVSFSLISAAVSIRVWVEAGITFESYAPVLFHAEAGVSVFVRFVIARLSAFGRSWEIAINFSFATRVRFSQKIIDSFDGPRPNLGTNHAPTPAQLALLEDERERFDQAVQPLKWLCHAFGGKPVVVSCSVSAEPMLSGPAPVLLPMLLASDVDAMANGLGGLSARLFEWAFRLSRNVGPSAQTPARFTLADLETLSSRVTPPKESLSRWGDMPLTFAVLEEFFEAHLKLDLITVAQLLATQSRILTLAGKAVPTKPTGVPLPWFADIAMSGSFDSAAPTRLRDFRGADLVTITKQWEDMLHDRLGQSIPDFPKDEKTQLKLDYLESKLQIMQTGDRQAMDVVVEDWAAAVVQGVVNQALRAARRMSEKATVDGKPPLDLRFESLLEVIKQPGSESVCLQVMQHASTFLHHGLRVPTADELSTEALPTLLKTELDLNSLRSQGKTCELSFSPRTGFAGNWIKGAASLSEFSPADALSSMLDAAKRLSSEKVDLTLELEDSIPGKTTQPRRFIASSLLPFGSAYAQQASLRMAAVPEALFALSQDRKAPLKIETALENPSKKSEPVPFAPRWYVKLEIRLEAAASATAVANPGTSRAVYSVLSVDPRIRELMNRMNASTGPAFAAKVRLGFKAKGDQPPVPFVFLEDKDAFLFVSNLSNEPRPPNPILATAKSSEAPFFSHLDDCMAVAQMLWMANTVNSPGFHLAFEGADPIEHLFKSESVASVSAVFELSALERFLPMVDGLLLDATQVEAGSIVSLMTPDVLELVAGTPDGQVAVVVTRSNPLYGVGLNDPVEDWRALSARYELVDYWTKSTAKTLALQRDSVMPVRVHMTESEQAEAVVNEPLAWPHRLLVPLSEISHRTLMRIGMAGERPNPYQFIGEDLKDLIEVGARDGAGHLLEVGVNAHWKAGSETRILYRDSIFKLQELPGVTSTWNLAKVSTTAAEMQLALDWNSDVLLIPVPAKPSPGPAPQPQPIPDDQRLAYLTQFRRYVDMVGMADFTASIVVSMGDAPFGSPLDVKTAVLDWLKEICAAIEASGKGVKNCKLPKFSVPLDKLPKTTEKPVLVSVAMELRRRKTLCDKRSGHDEVGFSSSPIHPRQLQSDKDWEDWSKRVGTALGGAFTLLRRVEGRTEPSRTRREGSMIFLMRRSMLSTSKVKAATTDYFAPTPLAKTLLSGVAAVPTPNGPLTEFEVRDVDLNTVAARASAALETLLTGQTGEALCRIAKPAGLYPRLTSAKKKLADNLAGRLWTLVDGGAQVPQATLIKFRDECRVDTRAAFSPNAAVTVGLPGVIPADNKVFLWGNLNVSPDGKMDPSLAFTSVRIALTSGGIGGSFDFVAKWTAQSASPLAKITGLMTFQPRYVEVQSDEDVVGYKPSDWYQVLWTTEIPVTEGITIKPNTGSEWQIPLPLRQVPPTPFILRQVCEPAAVPTSVPLGDYIAAARTWDYRLAFLSPKEEHDTAIATVRFQDASALRVMATGGLFAALVAFVKYEVLVAELTGQLCAGAVPDAGKLEMTVAMFECIAAHIGEMSARVSKTGLGSQSRVVSLNTVQPTKSGKLGEIHWAVDAVPNRPVRASLLSINAAEETETPIPADSESAGVARYKPRPDVTSAFAGLANVYPRRLSFEGLDVMVESRASASLVARRNADLIDKAKISEDFIFETASVRTPDSLVPHLAHVAAYDISFGDNTPRTIEHWLEQIEKQIFKGANRAGFAIELSAQLCLRLLQDSPTTGIQFKVPLPSIKGVPAMKDPTDTSDAWYKTLAGHLLTQARRLGDDAVENGFLELTVQVFATSGPESKLPALSLQNLRMPLAKIVLKSALEEFYKVRSLQADSAPTALQVAAYVFARTRRLSSKGSQLKQARKALAKFALSMDGVSPSDEALPSEQELASAKVRESWVACMVEAVAATRAARASSYAALVLGPAESQGNAPAAAVRHWAMAIEPSLAVKVAGPMSDETTNGPQCENIYLWGISLPAGIERKLISEKSVKTKIRPKSGKVKK